MGEIYLRKAWHHILFHYEEEVKEIQDQCFEQLHLLYEVIPQIYSGER